MREMKSAKSVTMKNGRPAMKGMCVNCGTNMMKIVSGTAKKATKSRGTRKGKRASSKRKTASKRK
tara:strand:- start:76 stop:270 length:195 start_codon:yes stop_codon:yes gene_type:complete